MDGMFYRRESDERFDEATPSPGTAKLLLITVIVAVAIVGGMLLLRQAGFNLTIPSEFPSISADAG